MYKDDFETEWMLTGDIIKGLKIPNLKTQDFTLTGNNNEYCVHKIQTNEYFVYLSHECDFNDSKRDFFLIAPLINIGHQIKNNDIQFKTLKDSNNIQVNTGYLTYFYFENCNLLGTDYIVDFTKIQSIHSKNKEILLENKILELDDENRTLLKNKLGYYFIHKH